MRSSARPAGRGHQRAQAGDGEEGGGPAAENGGQRDGAERRTEGEHEQKHKGQDQEKMFCVCISHKNIQINLLVPFNNTVIRKNTTDVTAPVWFQS